MDIILGGVIVTFILSLIFNVKAKTNPVWYWADRAVTLVMYVLTLSILGTWSAPNVLAYVCVAVLWGMFSLLEEKQTRADLAWIEKEREFDAEARMRFKEKQNVGTGKHNLL